MTFEIEYLNGEKESFIVFGNPTSFKLENNCFIQVTKGIESNKTISCGVKKIKQLNIKKP